jgi:hypothetical protein
MDAYNDTPETDTTAIVYLPDDRHLGTNYMEATFLDDGSYMDGHWEANQTGMDVEPTHWMPLPEPPMKQEGIHA